jgi:hypothetical protein
MQQMHDRPPAEVGEPSRRRPPRQRTSAPIPIPETPRRPDRAARLQDVLDAHVSAIDERIEQGLRALRTATAEAIRQAAEFRLAPPARNGITAQADALRGILSHAEERFQAITLRLQRMEGALRRLARTQREGSGAEDPGVVRDVQDRLSALARAVKDLATAQQRAVEQLAAAHQRGFDRLAEEHRSGIERLAAEQRLVGSWMVEQHREALADLEKRTGRGVVAVARRLHGDLAQRIDRIEAGGPRRSAAPEPALGRDPGPQDAPPRGSPPQQDDGPRAQ